MHYIELDARNWRDKDAFYVSLLPALGAPNWHGRVEREGDVTLVLS